MRNVARQRRDGRVAARVMIDGAALREVLNQYRTGGLLPDVARRQLLRLGVAGKAADALIHAFRPRTEAAQC